MNRRKVFKINQEDINRLAFMNWEKDGCPQGRDVDYWLEAESQLKATLHLLVSELAPKTTRKGVAINVGLNIRRKRLDGRRFVNRAS
jgi:hypothetical protein